MDREVLRELHLHKQFVFTLKLRVKYKLQWKIKKSKERIKFIIKGYLCLRSEQ